MRRSLVLSLLAFSCLGLVSGFAQEQKKKKARVSPAATVSATIGGNEVKVTYGRPSRKDPKTGEVRRIWGGLVPFGQVWRTGANEATLLSVAQPIVLGGFALPAGTYSLFTVPQADGSAKLIVNRRTGQWGIPYKEADEKANELARLDLVRAKTAAIVETFTMGVEATGPAAGRLSLAWEDTEYSITFTNRK